MDESALTGESLGVEKTTTIIKEENVPLGDRVNMVYSAVLSLREMFISCN